MSQRVWSPEYKSPESRILESRVKGPESKVHSARDQTPRGQCSDFFVLVPQCLSLSRDGTGNPDSELDGQSRRAIETGNRDGQSRRAFETGD